MGLVCRNRPAGWCVYSGVSKHPRPRARLGIRRRAMRPYLRPLCATPPLETRDEGCRHVTSGNSGEAARGGANAGVAAATASISIALSCLLPGVALSAETLTGLSPGDSASHGITITLERADVERLLQKEYAKRLHSFSDEQLASMLLKLTLESNAEDLSGDAKPLLLTAPDVKTLETTQSPALWPNEASSGDAAAIEATERSGRISEWPQDALLHSSSEPVKAASTEAADGDTAGMLEGILGEGELTQKLAEAVGISNEQQQTAQQLQQSGPSSWRSVQSSGYPLPELMTQVLARAGTMLTDGAQELLAKGQAAVLPSMPQVPSIPRLDSIRIPSRLIPAAGLAAAVAAATAIAAAVLKQSEKTNQSSQSSFGDSRAAAGSPEASQSSNRGRNARPEEVGSSNASSQVRNVAPVQPDELFNQSRGTNSSAYGAERVRQMDGPGNASVSMQAAGEVLWTRNEDDDSTARASDGGSQSERVGSTGDGSVLWQRADPRSAPRADMGRNMSSGRRPPQPRLSSPPRNPQQKNSNVLQVSSTMPVAVKGRQQQNQGLDGSVSRQSSRSNSFSQSPRKALGPRFQGPDGQIADYQQPARQNQQQDKKRS